jgi:hypothetical protein
LKVYVVKLIVFSGSDQTAVPDLVAGATEAKPSEAEVRKADTAQTVM